METDLKEMGVVVKNKMISGKAKSGYYDNLENCYLDIRVSFCKVHVEYLASNRLPLNKKAFCQCVHLIEILILQLEVQYADDILLL